MVGAGGVDSGVEVGGGAGMGVSEAFGVGTAIGSGEAVGAGVNVGDGAGSGEAVGAGVDVGDGAGTASVSRPDCSAPHPAASRINRQRSRPAAEWCGLAGRCAVLKVSTPS